MTLAHRVDLEVLVLAAGDVATAAVTAELAAAGVPFTAVDLEDPARPALDDAFLCAGSTALVRRARFQAIVAPNEAPAQLRGPERAALDAYQREFKVRRLDCYVYPSPAVHLAPPLYTGALDGLQARLTPAARSGPFGYLAGAVPFDDLSPEVSESYGYLALPLPDTAARSFTPHVEVLAPGSAQPAALLGVLRDDGREVMVISAALNSTQLQLQALFPGVLRWLTYGVHLGFERHALSVHVDDVFLADARWIPSQHCTRGTGCSGDAPDILFGLEDVDYLLDWQKRHGFVLDMVYNGGGYDARLEDQPAFPAAERLIARSSELRWINHTYSHEYLGCVRDDRVAGLPCTSQWVARATVEAEIRSNLEFACRHVLPIQAGELITGEHSGLRRAPVEASDNPNFAAALTASGIVWVASDASREPEQRAIGGARTVPRYPLNLYFNVATRAELVDEFNWLHASAADGGSGACADDPRASCLPPLAGAQDFERVVVPLEARALLSRALRNDPRPNYVHQSNVAEERLLYPVLERALGEYRALFGPDAPLLQPSFAEVGQELKQRAGFAARRAELSAYVSAGTLNLAVSGKGALRVPLTLPLGASLEAGALSPYAGQLVGWRSVKPLLGQAFALPATVGYAR
ncbi:MAG TPA: hypothetical protein VJR89_27335 [Polyangiales bacterium]|nr:hypothetical protein [Polyangiales bacterium]